MVRQDGIVAATGQRANTYDRRMTVMSEGARTNNDLTNDPSSCRRHEAVTFASPVVSSARTCVVTLDAGSPRRNPPKEIRALTRRARRNSVYHVDL
jgi:hypothetical protein